MMLVPAGYYGDNVDWWNYCRLMDKGDILTRWRQLSILPIPTAVDGLETLKVSTPRGMGISKELAKEGVPQRPEHDAG